VGYIERLRERRRRGERGAALVELAILAPLLILLVLGIIEFGWLFGQFNAVRHAAREGARIAAVNAGQGTADPSDQCDIYDVVEYSIEGLGGGLSNLTVSLTGQGASVGQEGSITVTVDVSGLSGAPIITSFLPDTLSSRADFRMEQPANWSNDTSGCG
jgi:Flp pilus assembly protein TadG